MRIDRHCPHVMELVQALSDVGLTSAEYAVLWHVRDTVVTDRDSLALWVAHHLPNHVPQDSTAEDCRAAIELLIRKGLLVELTDADLAGDLARWRAEPLPVSWGVDRDRCAGDIDLTESGFLACEDIASLTAPMRTRRPAQGYSAEEVGLVRVFGETEDACRDAVKHLVERIDQDPWRWSKASVRIEPIRAIGPWWHSRFEQVETGFEILVRR